MAAQPRASIEKTADATLAEVTPPPAPTTFKANLAAQIETWHANRGDRSVISSMIPRPNPNDKVEGEVVSKNPIKLFARLTPMGAAQYFCGWFCWMCDGLDYFAVSVTMSALAKQFGKSTADISFSLTLTLLFRSLGAFIFGILADRYGRRWTLVVNMLLIAAFELGSGFVNTYKEFLGVRACFGIVMGGVWGQASGQAFENIPFELRGFLAVPLQAGYTVGYILAAVFNLTVVQYSPYGWRTVYFIGAGFSLAAAILRAVLPDSPQYIESRREAKANGVSGREAMRSFFREIWGMLKTNWLRCIWALVFMSAMNFLSHGSQDLLPTFLIKSKGLTNKQSSRATIIANTIGLVIGPVFGYISQYLGRRLTMLVGIVWIGAWIPLWILPNNFGGLAVGAGMVQSGVIGLWGITGLLLAEIAPPAFRALFTGLLYQLGNMVSSASAQIEASAGDKIRITVHGVDSPDYGTVQAIFLGAVCGGLMLTILFGPDADGSRFENAKVAIQENAGTARTVDMVREAHEERRASEHDVKAKV
ncbi:Carboxylic acid transporter [Vanrija pseudolonga]|uniref:Carboxylic acid transporter n=1 Tax=Vanrija pseudolonga TaxID=143232 RepID=A0AAF0Y6N4_9TREE|nr:Carboxylic acid transporter [Vanrija pseudolonga]